MEEPTGDGEDGNAAAAVRLALPASMVGGEGESAKARASQPGSQGIYAAEESCASLRANGYVFQSS